ncbi:energy transducer TonB [Pseudomonas sp. LS44]|uniref:energy transducer TonB n=1 Tax=Pseudomonas sp. LS44 TaxID=1357074 RepID=UPI00215AF881|nr:energy transducer TonB [Pseudomonas sp. LS44]UVE19444.1 energy transducer TonB [Pseudomonas sp. LS44]
MGNAQSTASTQGLFWRETPSADLLDLGRPHRQPLGRDRQHHVRPKGALSRREGVLLGAFALVLHGALIYWLAQRPAPVLPEVPVEIPPMTIEFASPAPPVVEPPPPEPIVQPVEPPPPPVEELAVKPPPKPLPKLKPKPVPPPPKAAPKPVEPAPAAKEVAAPTPPPPAAVPVTPPTANAGYLRNPAPEYPSLAQRRGWEGTVLLRVHVLANGKPSEIQLQTSSGRESLDEAAVRAVKRWSFVPAKRGDVAQDGWVSVPIDFRLH